MVLAPLPWWQALQPLRPRCEPLISLAWLLGASKLCAAYQDTALGTFKVRVRKCYSSRHTLA